MYPIEFFYRGARDYAAAPAVIDANGVLTYGDLEREVNSLAVSLQALDPEPLSYVAVCSHNSREFIVAVLAVLAAGKTWVAIGPENAQSEMKRRANFTAPSIVITIEKYRELFADVAGHVLSLDRTGKDSVSALCAAFRGQRPRLHPVGLHEPQAIKFTGGSTGAPKGVLQSMRAWNVNIVSQISAWELRPGDRFLACSPLTHGASTYVLPTLATGGAVVVADRPRIPDILDLLERHDVTTVFVAPTVIYMMLDDPSIANRRLPHLRNLIYGGGPMRADDISKAQEIFGPVVASTYGQTEASQIATYIRGIDLHRPEKRGSVGRESPLTRVAIMKDQCLLPSGETGEIVIRGDLVMSGYLNQPEKTADAIIDGWLHTGDLGTIDQDGFVFVKGRIKDLIITGGLNVYPKDVEAALVRHEAVRDCAVFSTPDKKWGEAVHAAVTLHPGAVTNEQELIDFVKDALGSVAAPKSIVFYEALPRNAYGKIQKKQLIDDALKGIQEIKQ